MSHSYRKGFQYAGDKEFKKIFNRRLRRTDVLNDIDNRPSSYKKLNCPWDIADCRVEIPQTYEEFCSTYSWVMELPEDERRVEWNKYRNK